MPTYPVEYESPAEGTVWTYTADHPPSEGEVITLDGSKVTVVVDEVRVEPEGNVRMHVSRAPA
jgi:uncharacterized OB-fold protein